MAGRFDRIDQLLGKAEAVLERLVPRELPAVDFSSSVAFRWQRRDELDGSLEPVTHPHVPDLGELVGIDDIKDVVVRNTAQFVAGFPANNVLLWGERGCGKSTLVKGLLREFAGLGLRIVELKRWDILALPRIAGILRDQPFRFILFCDDLSFDEGEGDFRALKTLLDGDIEERPANILIYATSNRRHLLPEKISANTPDAEIHPEEAVGEKLALADRFGLSLGFYKLSQDEYLAIVRRYAAMRELALDDAELCRQALLWCGGTSRRSGRGARQFIDDLDGQMRLSQVVR